MDRLPSSDFDDDALVDAVLGRPQHDATGNPESGNRGTTATTATPTATTAPEHGPPGTPASNEARRLVVALVVIALIAVLVGALIARYRTDDAPRWPDWPYCTIDDGYRCCDGFGDEPWCCDSLQDGYRCCVQPFAPNAGLFDAEERFADDPQGRPFQRC